MPLDISHIDAAASAPAHHFTRKDAHARWKADPLSVVKEAGLDIDSLTQTQREALSEQLASIDPGAVDSARCIGCQTVIFSSLVAIEVTVVIVVITAIYLAIGVLIGADVAAPEVAPEAEGAAVAAAGVELTDAAADGVAMDIAEGPAASTGLRAAIRAGAAATGVTAQIFARACVTAFKAACAFVVRHPYVGFVASTVVMQFDRVLTDELCKARGACK
jgi:hypothetical protein